MAKNLTIAMTEAQATATATAIQNAYQSIDTKMAQIDSTMLSVAPLMATLKSTNGWKFLDNLDSEGNTDHKTFTKFAEDYFNKSHSVISETCKVGTRFFKDGQLVNQDYAEYGYTQLLRLSPLTDEQIAENDFNSEMSSVDIRKKVTEIVKGAKALTDSKKNKKDEAPTTSNSALNVALQSLGVEPLPEDEPTSTPAQSLSYYVDELPEAVAEWFATLGTNEVTITVRG